MAAAEELVNLIRSIVREELAEKDTTELCTVTSVNPVNGRLSIYILPDKETIIPDIINASKYKFKSGDTAVLYKIRNKLNNAFVIAKVAGSEDTWWEQFLSSFAQSNNK